MNPIRKFATGGLAALMMTVGTAALAPSPALAGPPTPVAPAASEEASSKTLPQILRAERRALREQADRLRVAGFEKTRVERLIVTQKEAGKDVTVLETALATFTERVTAARADHLKAADILRKADGFGPNGQVVELEVARQTVKQAGDLLKSAHEHLDGSLKDLATAVKAWLDANGLKPEAPPAPKKPKTP
ncbi:MAG: hypothetical protein K1X39_08990 [Thermoflexales bacterium]|nr:hypothetical protein [Thermoflexales bacterium]